MVEASSQGHRHAVPVLETALNQLVTRSIASLVFAFHCLSSWLTTSTHSLSSSIRLSLFGLLGLLLGDLQALGQKRFGLFVLDFVLWLDGFGRVKDRRVREFGYA